MAKRAALKVGADVKTVDMFSGHTIEETVEEASRIAQNLDNEDVSRDTDTSVSTGIKSCARWLMESFSGRRSVSCVRGPSGGFVVCLLGTDSSGKMVLESSEFRLTDEQAKSLVGMIVSLEKGEGNAT